MAGTLDFGERALKLSLPGDRNDVLRPTRTELAYALEHFDDVGAQAALDGLLAGLSLDVVVRDVLVRICTRSGSGGRAVSSRSAEEHFISNLVRGRLLALARGWDRGHGPRAVLASAKEDQRDLPLLLFGVVLRTHGWRITFLGADTPVASLAQTVRAIEPDVVVVAGSVLGVLDPLVDQLREIARGARLYLAGAASNEDLARRADAVHLDGDLVAATRSVSAAAWST